MKKSLIYVTPIILITLATTFPGKKKITAVEMFDKVVQYYDPNGTWDTFSGSMRMHTIFDNEIIKKAIIKVLAISRTVRFPSERNRGKPSSKSMVPV